MLLVKKPPNTKTCPSPPSQFSSYFLGPSFNAKFLYLSVKSVVNKQSVTFALCAQELIDLKSTKNLPSPNQLSSARGFSILSESTALQITVSVLMTVECRVGTWKWTLESVEKPLTAGLLMMEKKTSIPAEWNSLEKVGNWQPRV